jgi:intracellular multiplication protein IcmL
MAAEYSDLMSSLPPEKENTPKSSKAKSQAEDVVMGEPLRVRVNFYRDNYRSLMVFTLILTLTAIALVGWIFYQRTHKPIPKYFVTMQNGELKQIKPLTQPNLTTRTLLNWVVEAGTTAFNFDFTNYQSSIKGLKGYFTPAGYKNYVASLQNSGTINQIISKNLAVSAVPTGVPVITREGPTPDGIYAWQVQLPLLVTYQSLSEVTKQNILLTMLVAEMPTIESPKGIGIASLKVTETG